MSRLPRIIGIFIYFFVLITSFYHLFKFYEIFESPQESFVAFFVAIGFEFSVIYFAYIYTKYNFASAKIALTMSLFIVWFGNIFIMGENIYVKKFDIELLNLEGIKFILAIIGSIFLPICTFFIGKILANLDMYRENIKKELVKIPEKEQESIIEEKVKEILVSSIETALENNDIIKANILAETVAEEPVVIPEEPSDSTSEEPIETALVVPEETIVPETDTIIVPVEEAPVEEVYPPYVKAPQVEKIKIVSKLKSKLQELFNA